ncbi:GreA/GreB family elongation factor [Demequina sp. B12]|uniref:GreA/GreB family elongation factor n=1 Tax=Demequina sp. B12 TaxID=2992757 RepID=UPI00237AB04F|nr:GreA/GreB family elongation factor [Demequina sp. B12]MDE0572308.1 GreA/GreB family elongation factor [Demequina sp. B12]
MATDVVWMTAAAHERLLAEQATLEIDGRELTATERARLAELRDLLAKAQVSTMPDDGLVEPGMRVTVRFDDNGDTTEFVLGDRAMLALDPTIDLPVYSPTSPLGAAINGLFPGDQATIDAPRGPRTLTIVQAHPVT